ncbi:MAG: hypothetical protein QOE13_3105, partial [Gaiellaceae bacterium]|nr:hypothetical protein [Gaiellaceae bacterium]
MELLAQRPARVALVVLAALVLLTGTAHAQGLKFPPRQDRPPKGYSLTAQKVIRIADRQPKVIAEKHTLGKHLATAYTKGVGRWQVSFFRDGHEEVQVQVDDRTGAVIEQWSGDQVAWSMARGYAGAFGRKLNAPYVWIPLCLLFLAPFVDIR